MLYVPTFSLWQQPSSRSPPSLPSSLSALCLTRLLLLVSSQMARRTNTQTDTHRHTHSAAQNVTLLLRNLSSVFKFLTEVELLMNYCS